MKSTLFTLLFFCGLNLAGQKGPVAGTVRDAFSGEGLLGASVSIGPDGETVLSDAQGYFRFPETQSAQCRLQVSLDGFFPKDTMLELPLSKELLLLLVPRTTELKETVVTERLFQPPGGAQESVGSTYLERNQRGTFIQALEKLPGVNAINLGVGVSKPVLRGLSFQRVVVSNDGVKQEGQQWGADHGLEIDPFSVEQAQVIKGPVSLQYGSDGLGGAVEVLPARPPGRNSWRGGAQALWKSNNGQWGGSAWAQANHSDIFVMARYSQQAFGDFRVPADSFTYNGFELPLAGARLKNTAGRESSLSLAAGILRERAALRIAYSRYSLRSGLFPGATGIPRAYDLVDDGNPRGIALPNQGVDHQKVALHGTWSPRDGHLWKVVLAWQINQREELGVPDLHGRPVMDTTRVALGLRLETWSGNLQYEFRGGAWQHLTGFSGQLQRNKRHGFEFLLPDFRLWRSGVFWLSQFRAKAWLFSAGMRIELGGNQNDAYDLLTGFDAMGQAVFQRRTDGQTRFFSNIAAALKAAKGIPGTDRWAYQASFGKSFRMPHPVETASNGVHHGTFRHEQGTDGLRAEHGWQLDLGADFCPAPKFRFGAAVFGYFFQNYIYLGPTGEFSDLPEGGQVYRYRQNDAVYAGAEWRMAYEGRFVALAQSADYVWNQNVQTALPLPFTPAARLQAEATFFLPQHREQYLRLSARYAFAQKHTDRNEAETPGSLLLDLAGGAEIRVKGQRIQFFGELQNIFDTAYLNHLSRYRMLNLPEQGRNLILGIRLAFEGTISSAPSAR